MVESYYETYSVTEIPAVRLPVSSRNRPLTGKGFHFIKSSIILFAGGAHMKIRLIIDKKYTEPEIHICNEERNQETDRLAQLVSQAVSTTITGYSEQGIELLTCDSIIRIYTENQKIYAATAKGIYRLHERLFELEELLDGRWFTRISNSEIVNLRKIKRLDTSVIGTILMFLEEDLTTYVSRRYVSRLKKVLGI
jgi:DNA-binding LytR/AlgR family response regulator